MMGLVRCNNGHGRAKAGGLQGKALCSPTLGYNESDRKHPEYINHSQADYLIVML